MLLDFRSIPIILLPAILFFSSISVQMGATPSLVSYPKFAPGPEPLYNLATDLQPPVVVDPISIEAIRQTLALYPFAIDGKNWNALSRIVSTSALFAPVSGLRAPKYPTVIHYHASIMLSRIRLSRQVNLLTTPSVYPHRPRQLLQSPRRAPRDRRNHLRPL